MPAQAVTRTAIRKAKADKPAPVAAYDQHGKLIGVIMDPSKITFMADASPAMDLEPLPPAEVGTAADAVAKVRKAFVSECDPREKNILANAMQAAAISTLQRIHQRPPAAR